MYSERQSTTGGFGAAAGSGPVIGRDVLQQADKGEIDRVLKRSGQCVLVVQDSFYKDVPNDVPRIFEEMARHLGWHLNERIDFLVKQTFAGVNPQVKKYRNRFDATESVLIFSK